MNTFVQLSVNGIGKGAVFALLALGFVVIFKATEVVNFAHGSFVMFGGYLVAATRDTLGWAGAAALGIVCAGLLALALERLLSRSRHADPFSLALLTIGADVVITEEIVRRIGVSVPFIGDGWDGHPVTVGGITLFRTHLVALAVATVLIGAFFLAFRYSTWGIRIRAQAENREAAALAGIRSSHVTAVAWLVSRRARRSRGAVHRHPGLLRQPACRAAPTPSHWPPSPRRSSAASTPPRAPWSAGSPSVWWTRCPRTTSPSPSPRARSSW